MAGNHAERLFLQEAPFSGPSPVSCLELRPTLKGQEGTQGHTADPESLLTLHPTRGGG